MIVPLKKLTLLVFYRDKTTVLARLQRLGIMHLEISPRFASRRQQKLQKMRERLFNSSDILRQLKAEKDTCVLPSRTDFNSNIYLVIKAIEQKKKEIERNQEAVEEIAKDIARQEPWGNFQWALLDQLRSGGIRVYFYTASFKAFEKFDFSQYTVQEISRLNGRVYFLVFQYQEKAPLFPFDEQHPPRRSLGELQNDKIFLEQRILTAKSELKDFLTIESRLQAELERLNTLLLLENARLSAQSDSSEKIVFFTGWLPAQKSEEMLQWLNEQKIAGLLENPAPDEEPPVLLHNNFFARAFEPITRIFSLPAYTEIDPTPFFAPFFLMFFGFCLGDFGYAIILTLLSVLGLLFLKKDFRPLALLVLFLSLATVASGIVFNTFFGMNLFVINPGDKALLQNGGQLALFAPQEQNGQTTFPAMTLSLLLGFVQILLGIFVSGLNALMQNGWRYTLQPLGTMLIIVGGALSAVHVDILSLGFNSQLQIGPLAVGSFLAQAGYDTGLYLLLAGLLLFFLYNNPAKKIFWRPLTGLWEFYQFATGLLGDLLSYIRLFALGLASGLLGNAFNYIAFMVLPVQNGEAVLTSPMIIVTVMILIVGHGLNLMLSILGSFVHPLRLTFVEFYKNLKFTGGGKEFRLFSLQQKQS